VTPRLGSASATVKAGGAGSRDKRHVTVGLGLARWLLTLLVTMLATVVIGGRPAASHAPHDDIADIAISPAYRDDQTVFAIVRSRLMRSTDGGSTWSEIVRGLGDESRALARVAVAPSDPDVIYLTTHGDGVLRSDDRGTSWRPASGGLADLTLQEVAVSPTAPQIVFAAGALTGGLFRTTDGGVTWSTVPGLNDVKTITFLPGESLLVGDAEGRIATSPDLGQTWRPPAMLGDADAVTAAVASSGSEPGVVYAATASGRLFRSDDGARSFTRIGEGLPAEEIRSLELSPDHAHDATLWASTWDSGVFRSTDGGMSWEPMADGLTTDPQADDIGVPQFRAVAAALDGSGDLSLFVGGFDGLFRYDDGRSRWSSVETLTDYVVGLAVSPNFRNDATIAVTTYVKGAFVSDDGGRRWRFANDGLTVDGLGPGNKFAPLRRLQNVVFSPDYADDGTIFSSSWVTVVKSTDRGASWKEIDVSPAAPGEALRQFVLAVSPSYASDQTVFAATRQGQVYRSEGGGEPGTWNEVGRLGERVRSLVLSPRFADDRVLYAGTVAGVYVSEDAGATWKAAGPRMVNHPEGRETDPGALVAISPTYGADGTAFVGTDSGLFVTRDAGRSWIEVMDARLTATSPIEAVAVSPDYHNDRTVLVSTRERGLLLSTDGATSFRPVGIELLDANHLVTDFSNPTSAPIQFSPAFATDRTIFAFAQTNVLRSTDGGQSWDVLDLPGAHEVLESLGVEPGAETNGRERGWFETPIGNLSVRRVLVAVGVGIASFAALTCLGVGGRRSGRALALHLGGGVVVVALALVALAR
jgi:photosystem II stability/assembly factor-like uncharacterized protein